ncbi:DUF167 domain-containing protein [Geobacter sulfurreducens]|uniref:DUF167 domain-containing protein n=1 Tax=Geobacter sulfurreducens TaxID=35554 RepID=UPI002BA16B1B|nr:DUF167 domain-containing protein [Geobacter sulfurreducens]HML79194.1 DUF167 domain-containing protein [Geobacter sulfurreducens]
MPDPPSPALRITESADGVTFSVHVQPRASRNEVCGVQGEAIKLRLTSPPVEGEANRLCVEFLAKRLGVPKSCVAIIAGEKSRHKTIRVSGSDAAAVRALLENSRR